MMLKHARLVAMEPFKTVIGYSTIVSGSDAFQGGYRVGAAYYNRHFRGKPMDAEETHAFLLERMISQIETRDNRFQEWNFGFLLGFSHAIVASEDATKRLLEVSIYFDPQEYNLKACLLHYRHVWAQLHDCQICRSCGKKEARGEK
ncbi:hypothetical protein [Thermosporothrix hazakensis]|nr:hypothetical protein [Thermosporothrix hazakensis]